MCPGGEIGRRNGLKIRYPHGCVGSIPTPGTNKTACLSKMRPTHPISLCDSSVTGAPESAFLRTPGEHPPDRSRGRSTAWQPPSGPFR